MLIRWAAFLGSLLLSLGLVGGCGGGEDGNVGLNSLVSVVAADSTVCPGGGNQICTGVDKNRNNVLDDAELRDGSCWAVCTGDVGSIGNSGHNTLLSATVDPPSDECPFGGVLITMGVDTNDDGVLSTEESATTTPHRLCSTVLPSFDGVVFLAKIVGESLALYRVNSDGKTPALKLAATSDGNSTIETFKVSPDRKWIAFVAKMEATSPRELYVASLFDERPVTKVSGPTLSGATGVIGSLFDWSPNGAYLGYVADLNGGDHYASLYTVAAYGTGHMIVSATSISGPSDPSAFVCSFAWSPDSTRIVFHTDVGSGHTPSPYIWIAKGRVLGPRILVDSGSAVAAVAWSPDATRVSYFVSRSPTPAYYEPWLAMITDDGSFQKNRVTASGNGIMCTNAPTDPTVPLPTGRWEPSGMYYAMTCPLYNSGTNARMLLAMSKAGAETALFVSDLASDTVDYLWAPAPQDGSYQLAYVLSATAGRSLYLSASDNWPGVRQLTGAGVSVAQIAWQPVTGSRIAFTTTPEAALYTVEAVGGTPVLLHPGIADTTLASSWSPDGLHLAYRAVTPKANPELFIVAPEGPQGGTSITKSMISSAGGVSSFGWSRDGMHVAYLADDDGPGPVVSELLISSLDPSVGGVLGVEVSPAASTVASFCWP